MSTSFKRALSCGHLGSASSRCPRSHRFCRRIACGIALLAALIFNKALLAPNLAGKEQDDVLRWTRGGLSVPTIRAISKKQRRLHSVSAPDITIVRRFLRGKTFRHGAVEMGGRKKACTRANVLTANRVQVALVKKNPSRYVMVCKRFVYVSSGV